MKLTVSQKRSVLDSVTYAVEGLWLGRERAHPSPFLRQTAAEIANALPPELKHHPEARAEAYRLAREQWRLLFVADELERDRTRRAGESLTRG